MEKLYRHEPQNLDYEIRRIYNLILEYLKLDGSNANTLINLQGQNLVTLGSIGAGTITPRRKIDALDASNAQIRATHTDNTIYTELQTNASGYFSLMPSGERVGFNCVPEANLHVRGVNNATFLVELDVTGTGSAGFQFKLSPAGLNRKFTDFSIGEYQVIQRFINDTYTAAKNFFKVTKGGADGYTPVYVDFEYGNLTIGGEYGTSRLQLAAGTAAASSSPLKFISGPVLTAPEVGAVEFLTDDLYFTQTTGATRKKFVFDTRTVNGKALSSDITLSLASSDFANQGTTTTVLHGNAAGNPAFGAVVEADITLAANTTNDASATKHGFMPTAPSDATQGLLGATGVWGTVGYSPIGAIIAWHKSFANTPALPSNWVECNGQTLSYAGSVYNGQVIPNLNGAAAGADLSNGDNLGKTGDTFLRGDETSGVTQFDNMQGHYHSATTNAVLLVGGAGSASGPNIVSNAATVTVGSPTTDGTNGTPRTGTLTRPRNMSVVWIIRII